MKRLYGILWIVLLATTFGLKAQDVEFNASLSATEVTLNERFQLSFTLNASGSNFRAPDLSRHFKVLSGPNQSTQMSFINGKISSSMTYSFILMPINTGEFTIGPASIVVDGKVYKTQPLKIKVVKGSSATAQSQQNTRKKKKNDKLNLGDNLFIRIEVSKTQVYEGEQLTAVYKLYNRANLENISGEKLPEFDGFYTSEIDIKDNYSKQVIDGKLYDVYTIKKTVLIPQKTGKLKLKPLELEATVAVRVKQNTNSFWGPQYTYVRKNVKIKSNSVTIRVKPLPGGAPESFDGAVGQFTLKAALSPTELKVNDALNYKLTLTGTGNLPLINPEPPEFPVDFEAYDPKQKSNYSNKRGVIKGSKAWEYLLIPRHRGEYHIPAVAFTYFDPAAKKYITLTTDSFYVKVLPGENGEEIAPGGTTTYKKELERLGSDIRFIHTGNPRLHEKSDVFFGTVLYYLLLLMPSLIAVIAYAIISKREAMKRDTVTFKRTKATKIAVKRLRKAKKHLDAGETAPFYEEVFKALNGYFSDKLAIPVSELNKHNISSTLREKQVPDELIDEFNNVLETCEMARFSPAGGQDHQKVYERAKNVIVNLENHLK